MSLFNTIPLEANKAEPVIVVPVRVVTFADVELRLVIVADV